MSEAYTTEELVERLITLVEFINRAEHYLALDPERVQVGTSKIIAALDQARHSYDLLMAELKRRERNAEGAEVE